MTRGKQRAYVTTKRKGPMKLMVRAADGRTNLPVTVCLAHTEIPPTHESVRWYRQVWTEDATGRVTAVHKDNLGNLRVGGEAQ